MERTTVLLSALLLLAVPLSGCIAGGDDTGPESPNDTPNGSDGNQTEDPNESEGNETGNETGNASENETDEGGDGAEWQRENRTGQVSGVDLGATGPNASESVNVTEDTQQMYLNVTTEGGELEVRVQPPGCQESSCEETTTTEEGNASLHFPETTAGTYNVTLEPTGPGPHDVKYTLSIAQQIDTGEDGGFGF